MDSRGTSARGLRLVVFWLVVGVVALVDQATKAAVRQVVVPGGQPFVPGVLDLVLVETTGAAFSIGLGAGALFVLVALAVLACANVVVWRHADLPLPLVVAIGLVAGGGLGNMIDRVCKGSVTDFLATTFMNFPVFNVADVCVTVGVAVAFVLYLAWDRRRGKGGEEDA